MAIFIQIQLIITFSGQLSSKIRLLKRSMHALAVVPLDHKDCIFMNCYFPHSIEYSPYNDATCCHHSYYFDQPIQVVAGRKLIIRYFLFQGNFEFCKLTRSPRIVSNNFRFSSNNTLTLS